MANIKMNGIILSEHNLGDFDKMLTMLTPGIGKISCVAKGARRPSSSLLAGTQMFCFGEYLMYKGTSTYLKYAVHINKIVQDVTHENQNCYNILQLLLNTLYTISETDKDLDFVLSIFKLRLLCILGFTPNIRECISCKEKENLEFFSIKDDGFKCKVCGKQDTSVLEMSESAKNAIIYTITAPAKKLYSFKIKEESLEEFKLIAKIYFNQKLEKEYKLEELF